MYCFTSVSYQVNKKKKLMKEMFKNENFRNHAFHFRLFLFLNVSMKLNWIR